MKCEKADSRRVRFTGQDFDTGQIRIFLVTVSGYCVCTVIFRTKCMYYICICTYVCIRSLHLCVSECALVIVYTPSFRAGFAR